MMDSSQAKAQIYTDFSNFAQLKSKAKENDEATLKEVAKQFESIFLQMALKSMRQANSALGKQQLFNSNAMEFYEEMFDKQIALTLSGNNGLGLTDAIVAQLSKHQGIKANEKTEGVNTNISHLLNHQKEHTVKKEALFSQIFENPLQFVQTLLPDLKAAAEKIGLNPKMVMAQAALETGWGKKILKHPDGRSTHNLFNIKTALDAKEDKVVKSVLEYENLTPKKELSAFKSYPNFTESFKDFVNLIQNNPRYSDAFKMRHEPEKFIHQLQAAGYATDPKYAEKILRLFRGETLNAAMFSRETP